MKLVSTIKFKPEQLELMKDLEIVDGIKSEDLKEQIEDADIFFGTMDQETFRRAKALKWWHIQFSGVDHFLYPEVIDSNVILTNSRGLHSDTIADHVFMLTLALLRDLPKAIDNQKKHLWDHYPARELKGMTMGIIGLGQIGRTIAFRAKHFGLNTRGVRFSPEPVDSVDVVYSPDELHDFLPFCDLLVLICPLTEKTRGLIGPKELALLPKGSYLINVARGPILDEQAIYESLANGHLAGAGLDVFTEEPLPAESPLWSQPGVIITPHNAGTQKDYLAKATAMFIDNLNLYRACKTLKNIINKELGY